VPVLFVVWWFLPDGLCHPLTTPALECQNPLRAASLGVFRALAKLDRRFICSLPKHVPPYCLQDSPATVVSSVSMAKDAVWGLAVLLAALAGWMDWRSRRIPNWLTVPGLLLGLAANTMAWGWAGAKASLLGAGLGLLLLLPFVLIRSLGAGDWKLVGAVGAFLGPQALITVLAITILVAGIMAVALIVIKGRTRQTARNLGRMLGAMLTLRLPGPEVSLDNPQALKIPFGVAVALSVILFAARQLWVPS
jgi:prepilin peptidase CpaA